MKIPAHKTVDSGSEEEGAEKCAEDEEEELELDVELTEALQKGEAIIESERTSISNGGFLLRRRVESAIAFAVSDSNQVKRRHFPTT